MSEMRDLQADKAFVSSLDGIGTSYLVETIADHAIDRAVAAENERDELRKRVEELEAIELEYKALRAIMNRAKQLARQEVEDEENERPRFKMDANGNLTRIEDIQ